ELRRAGADLLADRADIALPEIVGRREEQLSRRHPLHPAAEVALRRAEGHLDVEHQAPRLSVSVFHGPCTSREHGPERVSSRASRSLEERALERRYAYLKAGPDRYRNTPSDRRTSSVTGGDTARCAPARRPAQRLSDRWPC